MSARPRIRPGYIDPLELAITGAVTKALRRRADAIRKRASPGITVLDRGPVVIIITSESATSLKIAKAFDEIGNDLEADDRRS